MKSAYHRAAAYGLSAIISVAAAVAALPAAAQQPASERSCSDLWPGDAGACTPDRNPAHHGMATVPGKTPLQAAQPSNTVVARPWLKASGN